MVLGGWSCSRLKRSQTVNWTPVNGDWNTFTRGGCKMEWKKALGDSSIRPTESRKENGEETGFFIEDLLYLNIL